MLKYVFTVQLLLTAIFSNAQVPSKKMPPKITKEQHSSFLREKRAEIMSDSIAKRLKLDKTKSEQLLKANLLIETQKAVAWKEIPDRMLLSKKIQAIENQRNDLYRKIFSEAEYAQYMENKKQKIYK